jgi:hypothetical protein
MGRPLPNKFFRTANDVTANCQIQATCWGINDSAATAGALTGEKNPKKFKFDTPNGQGVGVLVNGPAPLASGQIVVTCQPQTSTPTVVATANAALKAITATVTAAGANYAANDYAIYAGGTYGAAANVKVLTVNANGAILTVSSPVNANGTQQYTVLPTNIAAITTTTTGNGSGAIFSSTFGLESSWIATAGTGYISANVTYSGAITAPTVSAPIVSSGTIAVQQLTISAPGSFSTFPSTAVVSGNAAIEYVKAIRDKKHLTTFTGNSYLFVPTSGNIPSSWSGKPTAYLDTL